MGGLNPEIHSLKGRWGLGLGYLYTQTEAGHTVDSDQFEPQLKDEDQADWHETKFWLNLLSIKGFYDLGDGQRLAFMFPLSIYKTSAKFKREGKYLPEFESIHHRNEILVDPGDLQLFFEQSFGNPGKGKGFFLNASLGLSVPTGVIQEDPYKLGRDGKKHQHLFPGSGTFIPFLGLRSQFYLADFSFVPSLSFTKSLYKNKHGFQKGGFAGAGLNTFWQPKKLKVFFSAGSSFRHEFPSTWSGEKDKNSGRNEMLFSLGAGYFISKTMVTSLNLKKPLILNQTGGQLSIPVIINLDFNFFKDPPKKNKK